MSGRPRRASAQRAHAETDSDDVVEVLDDSDAEEPRPKRRASRGRQTDADEDDEYDPNGNGGGDDDADEELDADAEDAEDAQAGRRKRGRPPVPPSRHQASPKRARPSAAVKQEHLDAAGAADDGEGPIIVPTPAIHRAEAKMIAYNNTAEGLNNGMARGPGMTQQGVDQLVRLVARHMIFTNSERPGVPVSRAEVTKLVSEAAGIASKRAGLPSLIIAIAQARLATYFGLEMVELTKPPQRAKDKGPAVPGEGSKHFVLRSLVPPTLYAAAVASRDAAAEHGFLGAILALLNTAGGSMAEEEMWKHLGDMGAARGATDHPTLGAAPTTLVEGFLRRRQLATERIQGADGPEIIYSIGENAMEEVGPDRLRRFVETEFADAA